MKYLSKNEKQTQDIAKKLAQKLKGGEVIALTGELGAGKTTFIKGLAEGLGVKKIITSPTFVLMKVYPVKSPERGIRLNGGLFHGVNPMESPQNGGLDKDELFNRVNSLPKSHIQTLCHADAYRIKNPQELANIGILEYFNNKNTVSVIEWADKIKKILPKKRMGIKLEFISLDRTRQNKKYFGKEITSRDKKENQRNIFIELFE